MSGAGNLFTVIEQNEYLKIDLKDISTLCGMNSSLKSTEGLMVLMPSKEYDFECLFFNPDGSTGMMCGNGARCIVRFAYDKFNITKDKVTFLMSGSIYEGMITDQVTVFFEKEKMLEETLININGKSLQVGYADVGSQHCILDSSVFANDIDNIEIDKIGRLVRYHDKFKPIGVNANFYQKINSNEVKLRTYERGVEAETGACGTGAISLALYLDKFTDYTLPISIIPSSGQKIIIDKKNSKILLTGPAEYLENKEVMLP